MNARVDSGADSVPYKKAAAFRKWITETDMDSLACEFAAEGPGQAPLRVRQDRKPH